MSHLNLSAALSVAAFPMNGEQRAERYVAGDVQIDTTVRETARGDHQDTQRAPHSLETEKPKKLNIIDFVRVKKNYDAHRRHVCECVCVCYCD